MSVGGVIYTESIEEADDTWIGSWVLTQAY